jgi:hypothetical protein
MMGRLVVSITRSAATETFLGAAKYYVDEMWPLVTRMYVWGLIGIWRFKETSLVGVPTVLANQKLTDFLGQLLRGNLAI